MTKREARVEALKIACTVLHRSITEEDTAKEEDPKIVAELWKIFRGLDNRLDRLEKK